MIPSCFVYYLFYDILLFSFFFFFSDYTYDLMMCVPVLSSGASRLRCVRVCEAT